MKITLYTLLTLIIFSCSAPKKEETSSADSPKNLVDTTKQIQEAVTPTQEDSPTPTVEEAGPFDGETNNFPFFEMEAPSGDSLEMEVNAGIGKLLQAYDTITYSTITSTYRWERPYLVPSQDGEGHMSTETQEEIKKWYFDRNNQLKVISSEHKWDSNFPFSASTLYLFSNDSLTVLSERTVSGGDITVINQTRVLASLCPRCGTEASYEDWEKGTPVRYVTQQYLEAKQQEHNESMLELISLIKSKRKNAKTEGIDLVFSINRTKEEEEKYKSPAITYPVKFSVDEKLYSNYISKK